MGLRYSMLLRYYAGEGGGPVGECPRRFGPKTQAFCGCENHPGWYLRGFCPAPFCPTFFHFAPLPDTPYRSPPLPPRKALSAKVFGGFPHRPWGFLQRTPRVAPNHAPTGPEIYREITDYTMKKSLLILSILGLGLAEFSFGEIPQEKCKCHCDKDPKCSCAKGKCKCHKPL